MASARAVQRRTSSAASSPTTSPSASGTGQRRPGEIDARGADADVQLDGPDGAVGGEQQRRGRAGRVDRDRGAAGRRRRGEIGPEGNGLADVGVGDSGEAAEVRGEGRPEERGVGEPPCQLLGDDGDLDAGGPRCAIAGVGPQLPPAGGCDGGVELGGPLEVVELPDRPRSEAVDELRGGAPEGQLLRGVADVHQPCVSGLPSRAR